MGLDINMATILADWIERYAIAGPMLTLGVQQLSFTSEQFRQADNRRDQERGSAITTAADLFSACGIEATFSLDISTDEGADFLFDLNNPLPPPDLVSRFAAVLNGGTLEHVFNLPNALSAITRLLRPGGCALHVVPVHNWVDHGFYQISPTLLFDYYTAARFEILEAAALFYPERQPDRCEIEPLPRRLRRRIQPGFRQSQGAMHVCRAQSRGRARRGDADPIALRRRAGATAAVVAVVCALFADRRRSPGRRMHALRSRSLPPRRRPGLACGPARRHSRGRRARCAGSLAAGAVRGRPLAGAGARPACADPCQGRRMLFALARQSVVFVVRRQRPQPQRPLLHRHHPAPLTPVGPQQLERRRFAAVQTVPVSLVGPGYRAVCLRALLEVQAAPTPASRSCSATAPLRTQPRDSPARCGAFPVLVRRSTPGRQTANRALFDPYSQEPR